MPKKILGFCIVGLLLVTVIAIASIHNTHNISLAAPASKAIPDRLQIARIGRNVVPLNNMAINTMAAITKSNVWIAGNYTNLSNQSQIFYEHFDGSQWYVISSPTFGSSSSIKSIVAISAKNIWAVGSYQNNGSNALIEHWDGLQWSHINNPNPTDFAHDSHLEAITARSSNDIWGVGSYIDTTYNKENVLIEHFDGSQWQAIPDPNTYVINRRLTTVTAITPNDIWATGSINLGMPFSERYNGIQWSIEETPDINGGNQGSTFLPSISGTSINDAWVIGNFTGTDLSGPVSEHWNGSNWFFISLQHLPGTAQTLSSVISLQEKNVWAMGTFSNGNVDQPLVTHWNGTVWNVVPLPHTLTKLNLWQRLGHSNTLMGIGTYNNHMTLISLNEE